MFDSNRVVLMRPVVRNGPPCSAPIFLLSLLMISTALIAACLIVTGCTTPVPAIITSFYLTSLSYSGNSSALSSSALHIANLTTLVSSDAGRNGSFSALRIGYRGVCVLYNTTATSSASWHCASHGRAFGDLADDPLDLIAVADLYQDKISFPTPLWAGIAFLGLGWLALVPNLLPLNVPFVARRVAAGATGVAALLLLGAMVLQQVSAGAVQALVMKLDLNAVQIQTGPVVVVFGWGAFALALMAAAVLALCGCLETRLERRSEPSFFDRGVGRDFGAAKQEMMLDEEKVMMEELSRKGTVRSRGHEEYVERQRLAKPETARLDTKMVTRNGRRASILGPHHHQRLHSDDYSSALVHAPLQRSHTTHMEHTPYADHHHHLASRSAALRRFNTVSGRNTHDPLQHPQPQYQHHHHPHPHISPMHAEYRDHPHARTVADEHEHEHEHEHMRTLTDTYHAARLAQHLAHGADGHAFPGAREHDPNRAPDETYVHGVLRVGDRARGGVFYPEPARAGERADLAGRRIGHVEVSSQPWARAESGLDLRPGRW